MLEAKLKQNRSKTAWNHAKLTVLALLLLQLQPNMNHKPLSLCEIHLKTGLKYHSLATLLPKWVRWGYLRVHGGIDKYYSLTPKGYKTLRSFNDGFFVYRRGQKVKFYQVNMSRIIKELIARGALE